MRKQASEILSDFRKRNVIESIVGPDTTVTGIASVEDSGPGDLVFVDKAEFVAQAIKAGPAAVVTTAKLAEQFTGLDCTSVLISNNVRLAQALLLQAYVDRDLYNPEWSRVHPRAIIHESVEVPEDAVIGPGAVLGRNVRVGQRTVVMSNVVVEEGARIGEAVVIHPNVVVGYDCEIGDRCIIKSGCVIGMEGFGFAQDSRRRSYRIPQLGRVVIGDDVVLGANCTVDRATYHETHIAAGCKIDALCHIAHNVELSEDCLLVAQTGIAGSTHLGKRVICSGQTGILDHLNIANDVVLVQRAGVIKDIEKPGVYAGHPLQPVRQYFKNASLLQRLVDIKKLVDSLAKKLVSIGQVDKRS